MAEKSKTVHVVELHGQTKNLQEALNNLKKGFNGMKMPPDLEKIFSKLEESIGSILRKTEKGIIPREDFTDTEKEVNKVKNAFDSLSGSIDSLKKSNNKKLLSMLPEDTVSKLSAAKKAYETYANTLSSVVTAEQNLENALKKKKEAEDSATNAANSTRAYKGKVTAAQKELDKHEEVTKALKEQAEATEELARAQKELESAKAQGKGEKALAAREAKVTKAQERKTLADNAVKGFDPKALKAQADAQQKLTAATEKYTIAKKASEDAERAKTSAEVAAQSASSSLERAKKKTEEQTNNEARALQALQSALIAVNPQYKNLAIEGKTTGKQLEFLKGIVEGLSEEELIKLKTSLGEIGNSFDNFQGGLSNLKGSLQGVKDETKALDDSLSKQAAFEARIKQFLGLQGAVQVLRRALSDAMSTIKELDATMAEMAVVTDLTVGDYWDQLPQYTERANKLGLAIGDVYKADTLFYQQGLKTKEVVEISTETMKMAAIAGLDTAEATDRMTAALRGFNMELNEVSAQKIADVYSELAAITAADVDEISTAMTKTASIASSAGMEFETTAAFLSQIIETTRESAETAGTAMKTVIARFQELKKSPDEIGEIDGEIVDANAIETALRSVGVSLRDAGGQFRELDDVFLELSGKWDTLDKNTQRYIATIAAGSRQQSRFIAMVSDYKRTTELVTAANNSAGASQEQFGKKAESLEFKINQLKNAWHEFTMGIMESDLVKFGVDILTKFLEIVNSATSGIEGLGGSLTKIISVVAVFKLASKIFGKIKQPLISFFTDVVKMSREEGEKAGKAFDKGVRTGATQKEKPKEEKPENRSPQSVGSWIKDKTGITDIKEGLGNKKKVRDNISAKRVSQQNAQQRYKAAKENAYKNPEELISARKELAKANREYKESLGGAKNEQEALLNAGKQGFDQLTSGMQKAGQAAVGLGMAVSMVGGALSSAGFEEAGDGISQLGNWIMIAGTAISTIVPLISLLGTTFTVAGEKISLAGLMAQAGWWPLLVLGLAIAAVVTTIILVANAIKKASPEYKLEQAQEAANKAADAADRATESYENLVDAFDGLEAGYKALKDLTRGTEEWNKAVNEINNSILDLIQRYPELAKFVDNEGGVLTIDMDDAAVQQVLKEAETSAIVAKNSATLANLSVAKAEDDLAYKNLDDNAKFGLGGANTAYGGAMSGAVVAGAVAGAGIGALIGTIVPVVGNAVGAAVGAGIGAVGGLIGGLFTGEAAKDAALEDTQNTTEALAKAIADGAIIDNGSGYDVKDAKKLAKYGIDANKLDEYYVQVGDSTDALHSFGDQLLQTSAQEEAAFAAVAASAYQLANTLGMTEKEQAQASNIVDDASVKKMYDENMAKLANTDFTAEKGLTDDQRKMRDDAIRAEYGADARIEGNKVTFRDAEGKQQTEELTNDELKAMIANNITTQETKTAIEMAPNVIDQVISQMGFSSSSKEAKAIEAAATDQEGGNLTDEEVQTLLGLDDEKLKSIYNKMSEEEQNVFGSQEEYLKKIKGAGEIANGAFENARKSIEKTGAEIKGFMTADMAEGFASKMEEVWKASGDEGVKQIQDAYNAMLAGKSDEEAQKITERMNSFDWSNAEQLLAFEIELEEQYGYSRDEAQAMTKAMTEGAKATSNLTTTVEIFGDFYHATEKLNAALEKTADLQWEYERMLKNGAKATELATNLEEQRQSILESGYQALAAYEAAKTDQATTYAKGVNLAGVGKDVTQYVKFDENTGTYDLTELQRQINAGQFGVEGTESRKTVEDYITELKEANKLAEDQLDAAKEAYESLEELNIQAEEAYWSLYKTIEDSVVDSLESQIALQENLLDATESANEKIIDKLQEQINSDRTARENEKQEEEINDLQARAAYLGMDTSDINALELLNLEKQIAEQEQDYQEKLVDQSLQLLQDANEKAAEQRKEQIDLARAQLEIYKNSPEFQANIENTLSEFLTQLKSGIDVRETTLGTTLMGQDFYQKMHPGEEATFWAGLTSDGGLAQYFIKTATNTDGTEEGSMAALLSEINTNIATAAAETNLSGNYSAVSEKAKLIKSKTGFEYTIPEFSSYYNADGSFNADSAKEDIVNANNAYTVVDTLQTNNSEGTAKYTSYQDSERLFDDKMLSEKDFYDTINRGGTVSVGEKEYTYDVLKSSLTNQSTTGDYKDYVDTFVSNRYGEKDQLTYIEEQFTDLMKQTTPARKSGEVAFRGWDTIANRHSDLIDAYSSAGGNISRLKYIFSENVYAGKGASGAINLENSNTRDIGGEGGILDFFDTKHRFTAIVGGKGGFWNASSSDFINFEWDSSNSGDIPIEQINAIVGDQPQNGWAVMVDGHPYIYDGEWRSVTKVIKGGNRYAEVLRGYKTGGLADFTGPAWLDGTPSKPEYILNAAQTERFFSLVDILEGIDTKDGGKKSTGDNYFDIEINVEKLENDYDVEKVAEKIRRMIYEDATYRNVNAINHIR